MRLDRPAVDPDAVGEARAGDHVVAAELVAAGHPAGLADADLRRDVDNIAVGETGRRALEELEKGEHLAAAFDLAGRKLARVGAVDRPAVPAPQPGGVHPPFLRMGPRA